MDQKPIATNALPVHLYVRCSTQEQADSGLGINAQNRMLDAFLTAKQWMPGFIFSDIPHSGADELGDRPGGAELLKSINAGPCVLIVAKLDRLFRNAGDACRLIADWYKRGVLLVSVAEGIDLTTPYGRFMAKLFALIAELERDTIVDRTTKAMDVKRQRGERITRDPPYGWSFRAGDRRHADGRPVEVLEPNHEERRHVATMKQLRRRGKSFREIAEEMDRRGVKPRRGGAWSHTTVRNICLAKYRRKIG